MLLFWKLKRNFFCNMAVVKIWKIGTRLDRTINYAEDKEKTENKEYTYSYDNQLHQTIGYAMNDYKTEKQFYVTGINCLPEKAYQEMMITKKQFNKTSGILGFHAYQSFKGHEVNPEKAHEMGIKLAEEMWGDRFEVIVTTHLNSNNIHNHFVLNSVSFVDGKKYYDNRYTYAEMRNISDNLCQEYGISVLEEKPCRKSKINYGNYCKAAENKSNYYSIAKQDVDRAIEQAYSYADFENLLRAMDYKLTYRAGVLSICREPYKRNIRISRSFGGDYTRERIEERIKETLSIGIPFIEVYGNQKKVSTKIVDRKKKAKGIKALYLHYCYLLKIFPNKEFAKKIPATIRADVYKLDDISKETELLSENNIDTYLDFQKYKTSINKEYDNKMKARSSLWDKVRDTSNKDHKLIYRRKIEKISNEIEELQYKKDLCNSIENRAPKIEVNLKEYEKGKEMVK